jgi:solute:Na+ symporter, SSS family
MVPVLSICCAVWLSSGAVAAAAPIDVPEAARSTLQWSQLPDLPDQFGFGGPYVGTHNGVLMVAGGANFPRGMPWEGGEKVWYDTIYVLENAAGTWQSPGKLPRRLAYGASISTDDGLLLIGGEEDGAAVADAYRLRWDAAGKKVIVTKLPSLPKPVSYIAGGIIDSVVYVVASSRGEGADRLDQKHLWSIDLARLGAADADQGGRWRQLQPWPGGPRHKCVVAVQSVGAQAQELFLFGGSNPRWNKDGSLDLARFEHYTDAYRYTPNKNVWTRLADLPVLADGREIDRKEQFAHQRWPLVAATAIDVGQSHILVFSGSTGRYITRPIETRPLFPRKVLAYHTITNSWTEVGKMPQGVVTTTATRWRQQNDLIVIPSGEIKPGVRVPAVQALALSSPPPEFGLLNYSILGVYLLAMVGVGGLFALRTKSTDDFFRGGQRVPFWVAGLSIFATMLSSITYVALPAKAYATDWLYYPAQLTIIPVALVVVYLAIPFFRQIDATSAYEYLEKRFSRPVRLIGSAQFVMFQIGRMAIVMYLPALALAAITPFSVIQCILIMGVLSVIYCTLGGVEAVVWTDAIQTIVLMGGLLVAVAVIVANVDGGAAAVYSTALADGKMHLATLDFGPGSIATNALWVILLGMFFQSLYSYTSDQAIVQRYMTTSDIRGARRAMWTTAWMGVFGSLLFFVVGAALYVFYKHHPAKLELTMKTDAVFPLFISRELPMGLAGLVVAGIFAAAQSTISTSMNSTATALVTDFCKPLNCCKDDRGYLRLGRIFTFALGLFGTLCACVLDFFDVKSMVDQFMMMLGLFGGSLCGLFMLGMLTRRANATGGLVGALTGLIVVWCVKYFTPVNLFLYAMIGTVTTFVAGYLVSLVTPAEEKDILPLTIYRQRPLEGVRPSPPESSP